MGKIIGIEGESGTGKSTSIEGLEPDKVGIFNASGKPLPFPKRFPVANTTDYELIKSKLRENSLNCYILDDIGLTMAFYLFDKVNETGYGKFTAVAKNFYDLVKCAMWETSDDTTIYFIMHTERSEDGARIKMKTAGKMIDNQLTLESLFSIVLYCTTDGKKHVFQTQSDGVTTAKSPKGMFEFEIPNDLKAVDDRIREYYGMADRVAAKKEQKDRAEVSTSSKVPGGK